MPVSLMNAFVVELLPVVDLRPLPGVERERGAFPLEMRTLLDSLRTYGVLVPLVVRPARVGLVVQAGRWEGRRGWFLIDPSQRRPGNRYAGLPPFYASRRAAVAALPADVPWEVVDGCRRLAVARRLRLEYLPCLITDLSDAQVRHVRRRG